MFKVIVKVIVALYCLHAVAAGEQRPQWTWELDGKAVTSLITQDTVSRGTTGKGDIDYNATGVFVSEDGKTLTQRMRTMTTWENKWGSRLYLLNADLQNYEIVDLKGKELSFDVDMSALPCSINAALYTVEMPKGGAANDAQYGTGYCDAQGSGSGACNELDIWEANSAATQLAVHACTPAGRGGTCDSGGCNDNPYRTDKTFYGSSEKFTLDTSKPFTVVTQFVTSGGALTEVIRKYVQGGKTIPTPPVTAGGTEYTSLTNPFCAATGAKPLDGMSTSLDAGHVVVVSLWASDDAGGMDWLDSGNNGPCAANDPDGAREQLIKKYPDALVKYSNLKITTL
uniref:cellulose 1,4-beta-cellobiosidase (non-reducing end) n=1 Tax=uncultured symbiotic protist of Reticulitermes speratus TaxID=403658 RepID=A4UWN4_9EUKA|nr:putative glycosyl hydrolase family7 [uncultured symbiotic protist of Reticulitermes speratus]